MSNSQKFLRNIFLIITAILYFTYEIEGGCDPAITGCPSSSGTITYLPHPDCNKYYICKDGCKDLEQCNPGQSFDMTLEDCVDDPTCDPEGAKCETGTDPRCKCGASSREYLMDPVICTSFVECLPPGAGKLARSVSLPCPSAAFFNGTRCTDKGNANSCCSRPGSIC